MTEVVLQFTYERETKNTVRFQEVESASGDPPAIGVLYVQKWVLRRLGNPKTLSVTVRESAEEAHARASG